MSSYPGSSSSSGPSKSNQTSAQRDFSPSTTLFSSQPQSRSSRVPPQPTLSLAGGPTVGGTISTSILSSGLASSSMSALPPHSIPRRASSGAENAQHINNASANVLQQQHMYYPGSEQHTSPYKQSSSLIGSNELGISSGYDKNSASAQQPPNYGYHPNSPPLTGTRTDLVEDQTAPIYSINDEEAKSESKAASVQQQTDFRKKKRNRTIQSCLPCHQNKRKCDRNRPCGRCTQLGVTGTCVYEVEDPTIAAAATNPSYSDNPTEDRLRSRIAELEGVIRELKHKSGSSTSQPSSKRQRTTEKDGNEAKDKSPELTLVLDDGQKMIMGEEVMTGNTNSRLYLGGSAGNGLLRKIVNLTPGNAKNEGDAEETLKTVRSQILSGVLPDSQHGYPFTTIWSSEAFFEEVLPFLPDQYQSEILLETFISDVASLFNAWHLPTLVEEYRRFYRARFYEKRTTPLPIISKILAMTSVSILLRTNVGPIVFHNASSQENDPTRDVQRSNLYLSAAYHSLRLCNFTSSPTLDTICSQFIIGVWLMTNERLSEFWSHCGSMVRHSQAIGLHIDPLRLDPEMDVLEQEVRRRIWWSISSLDGIMSLMFGRPSGITYYDTQLPRFDISEAQLAEYSQSRTPLPAFKRPVTVNDMSYHGSNWALTIPSEDLLRRMYKGDRQYSRDPNRGYFSPALVPNSSSSSGTYSSLVKLDDDYAAWYDSIPMDMQFDPDSDPAVLSQTREKIPLMQSLILCVKVQMMRLVLHRPYLMSDPKMYPESSKRCLAAAHRLLMAFSVLHLPELRDTCALKYFTIWFRAFNAGAVIAFIALREPEAPGAELARSDLRHLVSIFSNKENQTRVGSAHGRLRSGLIDLENLTIIALRQHCESNNQTPRPIASPIPPPPYHADGRQYSSQSANQGSNHGSSIAAFPPLPNNSTAAPPIGLYNRLPAFQAPIFEVPETSAQQAFSDSNMMPSSPFASGFNDPVELSRFWRDLFQLTESDPMAQS